ncbi:MAG: CHASE2 domain-containing protein [Candidatus Omnitrophica bacterium]|nr:CHASE2 domain-containing protein [Candidatus Omnitrophota bacterium]
MVRPSRSEHLLRLGLIGVALTLVYLAILVPTGLLQNARFRSADTFARWRHTLRKPPPETGQLLLITIDEESQRKLHQKWPWPRGLLASCLSRVGKAGPALVFFDLVFAGASDPAEDAALAQAIREGPPVLLASYIDQRGQPLLPLPLFTEAGGVPGLINKPRDSDHVVRRLWAGVRLSGHPEPLYAMEINAACTALGIPRERIRMDNRALWAGDRRVPIEHPGMLWITPLVDESQVATLPFWKALEGDFPPEQVRGKIVILGTSSEITHDFYPTPLGTMAGVMLNVNGTLTLLTEDYLRPFPAAAALTAGGALSLAVLFLTFLLPIPWGMPAAAGIALLSSGAAFLVHFFLGYRVECLSLFILAGLAWVAGLLYRYAFLAWETLRLHRQVITDPLSGVYSARYLAARIQSAVLRQAPGRKPLAVCAVLTEKPSDLLQRFSPEEVRSHLRRMGESLHQAKPGGGLVGRLSEDSFGVFLPRMGREEAGRWADPLRASLRTDLGTPAVGVASTDQPNVRSAEELIRAALRDAGAKTAPASQPSREMPGPLEFVSSELEDRSAALEKALGDLRTAHKELEQNFLEVTKSLVAALETKDEYTAGHLERVSRYATRLAEELHLPRPEVEAIREAALLHDIGKIGIPDEVLHKVGQLTEEEKGFIRQHLALGAKILEPMKFFHPITTLIYHHHERFDGKGYPHGLTGELIPAGAQVITIADSFDAMTTARSYNKPKNVHDAIEEIRKGAGTQFNPKYVEAFVELILREGPQLAGHHAPL